MRQQLISAMLWFSAMGCGLMAGVYFAFSAFVMTAFNRLGPAPAIAAMNAINVQIVTSLFMPLFISTTLASGILILLWFARLGSQVTVYGLVGSVVYLLGMFVITAVANAPLNDGLAAATGLQPQGAAQFWARYFNDWSLWNHVRTVASLCASILFTLAISIK